MRYIIVTLALALLVFWLVRAARGSGSGEKLPKREPGPGRQPPLQVQDMVSCAHCGVHLPKAESVTGKRAVYCSLEHQRQAEP